MDEIKQKKVVYAVSFVVVFILLGISSFWYYLSEISKGYMDIYEHSFFIRNACSEINSNAIRIEKDAVNAVLGKQSGEKERVLKKFRELDAENRRIISGIKEKHLGPRADVEELEKNYLLFNSELEKVILALKGSNNGAAIAELRSYQKTGVGQAFKKNAEAIHAFVDAKAEKTYRGLVINETLLRKTFYLVFLALCLLGVGLIYFLVKSREHFIGYSRTRNSLRKKEEEYRDLVENINDVIFSIDIQGFITYASPVAESLSGFSPVDLVGHKFYELIHPEDLPGLFKSFKEALSGRPQTSEFRFARKGGGWFWTRSSSRPFYEKGKVAGINGIVSDITSLKEKEFQLSESEKRYKSVFYDLAVPKWILDPEDGRILEVNNAACSFYGLPREKMLKMKVSQINVMPSSELKKAMDKIQAGKSEDFECKHRLADGSLRDVHVYSNSIELGGKKVLYGIIRDITEMRKAEAEKNRLFDMVDKSLNEIYVFRADTFAFEYVNRGALSNLGYTLEEMKKLTPLSLKPEYTEKSFREMTKPLIKGEKEKIVFYTRHKRKNGSFYPVEVHLQYYGTGDYAVFFAVINDISERLSAEKNIKNLNSLYLTLSQANQEMIRASCEEELFDKIPEVVVKYGGFKIAWIGVPDPEGWVRPVSSSGKGRETVKELKINIDPARKESLSPTGLAFVKGEAVVNNNWTQNAGDVWKEPTEKEQIKSIAAFAIKKAGKVYRSFTLYTIENGYFTPERVNLLKELVGDMEYAVSKMETDKQSKENENLLKALVDNAKDYIFIKDLAGRYLSINPAMAELFSMEEREIKGKTDRELFPEDKRFPLSSSDSRVLKGEFVSEYVSKTVNGTEKVLHSIKVPVRDYTGKINGLCGIARDITSEVRARQDLVKSEAKHKAIFENMNSACCVDEIVYDSSGKAVDYVILDINPAFERILGLSREKTRGRKASEVYGTGEAPFLDIFSKVSETGEPAEFEAYFPPAGKYLSITVGSPGKGRFSTVFNDITEKKKSEKELLRFLSAIEQTGDAVVITDTRGIIKYVNPAFEKITGYTKAEAIGKTPSVLKSGKQDKKFYENLWNSITSSQVWTGVMINKKKDGTLYTEEAVISPVYDERGETINFVAVKRDITEKRQMQELLLQSQKMEAVGLLAGGVAHDFNNILTAIISYSEILMASPICVGREKEDMLEILSSAERGVSLTKQLLAFSRKQISAPKGADLNEIVENIGNMVSRLSGENIKVSLVKAKEPCKIFADPGQIEQMIINLAVNGRDAMKGKGDLKIETLNFSPEPEFFAVRPSLRAGRLSVLKIKDTGEGMSPEVKKRIFEPFFTTKEKGKGTGLGLSIVYGIVNQNKGLIEVESEQGRGSEFTVYFPYFEKPVTSLKPEKEHEYQPAGNESILLVEDEESLLRLGERVLKSSGYQVLSAPNSEKALELMEKHGAVDLLVTDLIMPGLTGKQLSDRLASEKKAKKTLFMSGYTDEIIGKHGVLEPGIFFIYKPFTVNSFLSKVREVLDSLKNR